MSSDCGFGRQGCNREIAFHKATAIAQGCNIVRQELGLSQTYVPAADPEASDRHRAEDGVAVTKLPPKGGSHRVGTEVPVATGWTDSGASALGGRCQRCVDDALRFAHHLVQVSAALEALGVDLVDVLGA